MAMMYFMILLLFIPTVLITVITPYITRKTESFGVSIPEEVYGSRELIEFRKKYAGRTALIGLSWLAVSIISGTIFEENTWMTIFIIALFLFLISSFSIYFSIHKKMKLLKAASNWKESKTETTIIDTNFRNRKLIYSPGWFVIGFIITVVTFAITMKYYDRIPLEIPMQYGFNGEVTKTAVKTFGSAFSIPLMQLFMLGLFLFINYTIGRSRQQVDAANPEKSIQQNIIFRRRWSAFIIITGTVLVALFSVMQYALIFPINMNILLYLWLVFTGAILAASVILSIITGQGGSRVKTAIGEQGEMINRDEDHYWKLGIFYFNSSDPAVWVEKRFGSGWTVNMAKPQAWIFFIIILAIPLLFGLLT